MCKEYKTIHKHIDPNITVGDTVTLIDGSGLCPVERDSTNYYINNSYPNKTGVRARLDEIPCEVLVTGIDNTITNSSVSSIAYLLDIKVQVGNARFYTCSKFVRKIEPVEVEELTVQEISERLGYEIKIVK